ncbi:MAG: hypothetical protein JO115_06270 [Pseudonocardiales bacterium]|nr:hypothetical protein [Pseudonocardiales bacterium]
MSGEDPGAAGQLVPSPPQWRDVEGTALPLLCRVEQIAVDPAGGAMSFRLHQQGQLVGWDTMWLHVCFDHHQVPILLRPHLVRVLDSSWGSR